MGNRLDGFDIELKFDANGEVSQISYWDQAGCGHERPLDASMTLEEVAKYHLDHYRTSHEMEPQQKCKFVVMIGGGRAGQGKAEPVRCSQDFGHKGSHTLEVQ